MFAFGGSSQAAFINKDSSTFANQYNAADGFLPATDPGGAYTNGAQGGSPANIGGILRYTTNAGQDNWWDASGWAANPAVGWTVEVEVFMSSIQAGDTGFQMTAGAGSSLGYGALQVKANSVVWGTTSFGTASNQDGFHVFRIAQEGNSNITSIWRDGLLVGSAVGTHTINGAWFGDGSTSSGHADIKYARWDTTGGYAPIPEPASLALMLAGGLVAIRRVRKA
jgi:hypothetical protein